MNLTAYEKSKFTKQIERKDFSKPSKEKNTNAVEISEKKMSFSLSYITENEMFIEKIEKPKDFNISDNR